MSNEFDIIKLGICDKCGREVTGERFAKEDYLPSFNLGRAGWGSCMDGSDIKFQVCSECLYEFIETFKVESREKIHNSGCNCHMETEDWIREANGEFTDEEYEERGYYSPRQINTYKENFPKCAHPILHTFDDGSGGMYCPYGASGNKDQSAGLNISKECYDCSNYVDKSLPNYQTLIASSYEIEFYRKSLFKRLAEDDEQFFKMLEEYNFDKIK